MIYNKDIEIKEKLYELYLSCSENNFPIFSEKSFFLTLKQKNNFIIYNSFSILIYQNLQEEAEIFFFGVKEENRRKKIGTKMFNKFLKFLKNDNVKKIFLEVDDKNKIAKLFYKSFEFKKINIRKNYYSSASGKKSNAILMCKSLEL